MRKLARIGGIIWMALVAVAGVFLLIAQASVAYGHFIRPYGVFLLVFGAAMPGLLAWRWGSGPMEKPTPVSSLGGRARISRLAESGHELHLDRLPEEPL